jgi:gliding motility-associated-like protein
MRIICSFFAALFIPSLSFGQCNNWLELPSYRSYVRIGDLDITGNKVTVEATFNRTIAWSGADVWQGDLVSKHDNPNDCNYLLRPGSAEITTTNGYFKTPAICPIELNKTYHVALVYDGSILKFYRNGFLMSQVPASGDLLQNNWQTQIGLFYNEVLPENFIGYINEVRIWNIARTQSEIKTYMNQSLPNPQTTPGLLAYYTFDNLLNKQGNTAWNGTVGGSAAINKANPNCAFVPDSCGILSTLVQAAFTAPDTVCVNSPVTITNNSVGANSYFWNFCVADVNKVPAAVNLGNPGGYFSEPVFMDMVEDNGNYYGFVVNHVPGGITRLDFGNSLLNTPSTVFLGNIGGVLNPGYGSEGIQIVKANGKWYGIVVGGNPASSGTPKLVTIYFGPSLNNPNPTAKDWGNLGNMLQSIDLHVFQENGTWYGFTVNAENNTITRFNFTNSFDNPPTAVNLGNIGNLNYPTGVYAVNDNGFWRVFVTNGFSSNPSITRLDFGNSLLNIPVGVNLGNPGNLLVRPRDITILKYCDQSTGFVVNASNQIIRLNFSSLTGIPSGTDLGNLGNLNFSHSLSKLFRVGNDIYSFITNVTNNTLTRLKFEGCNSSSIPSSTDKNPQPVIYNAPGKFNINLSIDDGLPTQTAFCKQVVVVSPPNHLPTKNIIICEGDSIKVGASPGLAKYTWSTNASNDSIFIDDPGIYWVETAVGGCVNRDSFKMAVNNKPIISLQNNVSICKGGSVVLSTYYSPDYSYNWFPSTGLSNTSGNTTNASPVITTKYQLKVTDGICTNLDSTVVVVNPVIFIKPADKEVCEGDTVQLISNNSAAHEWTPSAYLTNASVSNPFAFPQTTTNYQLKITNTACNNDTVFSVVVKVNPKPEVFAHKSNDITCAVPSSQLNAFGGVSYSWFPTYGLDDSFRANPTAIIDTTTTFTVTGVNEYGCSGYDTVLVHVNFVGEMLTLLPNAFTPNGDGKNDCFGIQKWGSVSNLEFSVFNRWGERVFYTNDPMQCWNGTYKGILQPNDVFVYIIKANSACGKVFVKGTVALIK